MAPKKAKVEKTNVKPAADEGSELQEAKQALLKKGKKMAKLTSVKSLPLFQTHQTT